MLWATGPYAGKYGGRTVAGMFDGCSFGMAEASKRVGSDLLRVAVPVPCSGRTPDGVPYHVDECPFNGGASRGERWRTGRSPLR